MAILRRFNLSLQVVFRHNLKTHNVAAWPSWSKYVSINLYFHSLVINQLFFFASHTCPSRNDQVTLREQMVDARTLNHEWIYDSFSSKCDFKQRYSRCLGNQWPGPVSFNHFSFLSFFFFSQCHWTSLYTIVRHSNNRNCWRKNIEPRVTL